MSDHLRWLIHPRDDWPEGWAEPQREIGGKGASLRILDQHGFRVPDGFVITTRACRAYFDADRKWPDGLWEQTREAVKELQCRVGREWGASVRPLTLAVRSGAARSLPGAMASILHCGAHCPTGQFEPAKASAWTDAAHFLRSLCDAWRLAEYIPSDLSHECFERASGGGLSPSDWDKLRALCQRRAGVDLLEDPWEALRQSIQAVWDSWHGPRARRFRRRLCWDGGAGTAVVVQVMCETRSAGVVFSAAPRTDGERLVCIEEIDGSGRALVAGERTPRRQYFDRSSFHCRPMSHQSAPDTPATQANSRTAPPGQQAWVLPIDKQQELARASVQLERLFGGPVDVEWGWDGVDLVFFQARLSIDSKDLAERDERLRSAEVRRLHRARRRRGAWWCRHNLADAVPNPTPLTWSILRRFMSGTGGFGQMYRALGYRPSRTVDREGFLELIGGQIYADVHRVPDLFRSGWPWGYDPESLRRDPHLLNAAPSRWDDERIDGWLWLRWPLYVWTSMRVSRRWRKLCVRAERTFREQALPAVERYVDEERARNGTPASLRECAEQLSYRFERFNRVACTLMLPGLLGGLALASLRRRLNELLLPHVAEAWTLRWAAATPDVAPPSSATDETHAVSPSARRRELLLRYGHRSECEWELAHPRWREEPWMWESWQNAVRRQQEVGEAQAAEAEQSLAELREELAQLGASCLAPDIERDAMLARGLLPLRNAGKDALMKVYALLRDTVRRLGDWTQWGSDVCFLTYEEWARIERPPVDTWERRIQRRRAKWEALHRLRFPDVIDVIEQAAKPGSIREVEIITGHTVYGEGLSPGVAEGPVTLCSPSVWTDGDRRLFDAILVCETLDPGPALLMPRVRGVIVERGGLLSHGAIVARQMGVPLIRVANATRIWQPGEIVVLDATRGRVARKQVEVP